MKSFYFRVPALLCGGICFLAFVGSMHKGPDWHQVVFLAFLPACFLLVGGLMLRMKREISRLRHRIAALEQREQPGSHTGAPHSSFINDR